MEFCYHIDDPKKRIYALLAWHQNLVECAIRPLPCRLKNGRVKSFEMGYHAKTNPTQIAKAERLAFFDGDIGGNRNIAALELAKQGSL